ncbi:response regulator [Roseibacterium sp. SDUM158017]|uniref:response regulator n=1 Tax=Roseicyclus salinarum TaxID=3036773 RepID=UPI0024156D22|nr:response regulator [Roseibacterium sp. SDUM158017]MDG4647355.1 response regulator [Roseibacterium sp. SDUM158017]
MEDDDGDAKAVRRAFDKAGVASAIVRAVDGVAALEYLRDPARTAEAPGLEGRILLVDINMPRLDGHAFVREIRADPKLRRLIVFMLTTSRAQADIEAAYDAHVAGYVVKQSAGGDVLELAGLLERFWRVVEIPRAQMAG